MLVDGIRAPGRHRIAWTAEGARGRASAGVYFVRYEAAGMRFTKRMLMLR